MRMRVAVTAFSLIVVLTIGSAASRAAPSSLGSGVVVYERGAEIFVANADGSGEKNLTRGRVHHAEDPDVSPDGTRIVFDDYIAPVSHRAMVMNVDGSGLHQVGRVHRTQPAPEWSPDGALIAYGGPPEGTLDVVAPDGSGLRTIATDVDSFGFSWAPSSLEIAYGSTNNVQAVTIVNGARRTIAQARANGVSWSPDGSKIAFTTNLGQRLWLVGADGAAAREVLFTEGSVDALSWSPNSDLIAFGAERRLGEPARIFALDVTSGGAIALTTPVFGEGSHSPSWSPDGSRLVYERERIGHFPHSESDVWVMNADGTAKIQLTSASSMSGRRDPFARLGGAGW
jgi:Tol biopolymer transport system component